MSPAIDPSDFLFSNELTEEERAVQPNHAPVRGHDGQAEHRVMVRGGTLPIELSKAIGDLGLLGMHLHGYGCAGADAVSYGLACFELEAGDSDLSSFVSVRLAGDARNLALRFRRAEAGICGRWPREMRLAALA